MGKRGKPTYLYTALVHRAKAKDTYSGESDWAELTVNMPRNRATYNSLFLRFLEQFPILRLLLQRLGLQ